MCKRWGKCDVKARPDGQKYSLSACHRCWQRANNTGVCVCVLLMLRGPTLTIMLVKGKVRLGYDSFRDRVRVSIYIYIHTLHPFILHFLPGVTDKDKLPSLCFFLFGLANWKGQHEVFITQTFRLPQQSGLAGNISAASCAPKPVSQFHIHLK